MDAVIYSASPLKAFSGAIIGLVIIFFVGLLAAFAAIASNKRRGQRYTRFMAGCSSLILFLAFGGIAVSTYNSFQNGDKTVQVRLEEKNEVTQKCNNTYCTSYVLDTTDGKKHYVFGVEKDIWDVMEVDACYQFTYYPVKPLLADYLREENAYADLYEPTGEITRIEKISCP